MTFATKQQNVVFFRFMCTSNSNANIIQHLFHYSTRMKKKEILTIQILLFDVLWVFLRLICFFWDLSNVHIAIVTGAHTNKKNLQLQRVLHFCIYSTTDFQIGWNQRKAVKMWNHIKNWTIFHCFAFCSSISFYEPF